MLLFFLLIVTIILAWTDQTRKLGFLTLAAFVGTGIVTGRIEILAAGSICILGVLFVHLSKAKAPFQFSPLFLLSLFSVVMLSILHNLQLIPGFHNYIVWDHIRVSPLRIPTTLSLNFDKPLFSICFLLFLGHQITCKIGFIHSLSVALKALLVLLPVLIGIGLATDFIAFDPQIPENGWLWATNTLFLTALPEEVFFRGFMQGWLFKNIQRKWVAVVIPALAFGFAHFGGGIHYIIAACITGTFYGLAFEKTKSIEAPVLCHLGVNLVYFFCFTYPWKP